MKTIFKVLLLVSFFACVCSLHARSPRKRFTSDIRGGVNFSKVNITGASNEQDTKLGIHIGGNLNYKIFQNIQVQTGFYVSKKGLKQHIITQTGVDPQAGQIFWTDMIYNTTANYIQIPLNLGYEVYITPKIAFNINAGLYGAYGFKGTKKTTGYDMSQIPPNSPVSNTRDDITEQTFYMKRWKRVDYGLNASAGFIYDIYTLNVNVEHGLYNVYDNTAISYKNRLVSVSLGFRF